MGQQFVEVTPLRYGGRSVISKRSLNGCSPGYKLSMASEGSRAALKHAATKQKLSASFHWLPLRPLFAALPSSNNDTIDSLFSRFVRVSLSLLLFSCKTKGTSATAREIVTPRFLIFREILPPKCAVARVRSV